MSTFGQLKESTQEAIELKDEKIVRWQQGRGSLGDKSTGIFVVGVSRAAKSSITILRSMRFTFDKPNV